MPEDDDGNKYFYAEETNNVGEPIYGDRYYYKIHSWKELGADEQTEGEPSEEELNKSDFLVIEISKGDDSLFSIFESPEWETTAGPWETYEQLEGILGEDFGEEGSRGQTAGFTL